MERFNLIQQLREQRKTYKEIAKILGISKQRIHQIYKNYKTLELEASQKIKKQNGNKCEICGTNENLEIHHKDRNTKNNNPENLNVFCSKHHGFIEKEMKRFLGIKRDSLGKGMYTTYIEKICPQCNKEFSLSKNSGIKFCSKQCHLKYYKAKKVFIICKTCGKKSSIELGNFKRQGKKYCSKKCCFNNLDWKIKVAKNMKKVNKLRLKNNI